MISAPVVESFGLYVQEPSMFLTDSSITRTVDTVARPRAFDETEVLRLARDRFWSSGFAGTSVDEVAAATGLGKGSLYGAFGDKRSLYLRVFDGYCADAVEGARQALGGPDADAYRRLRAYVLAIAAETAADSGHRGCLLANGTAELASEERAVVDTARRTVDAIEDALVGCI